ncbi:Hsp20/alpha crystallin family protein [Halohasta salina]|uniref:Hsp20/alpha crystallin family protein n=1 Tax=Halohasta salina TaxID=2961621 RepID=UPI0020A30B0C|nr:Hsp20 family protein [Halohasta salina]
MTGLKSYGKEAISTVLERVGRGVGQVQERKPLAYDLLETDEEYLVVFDAPGATTEDIQVRFMDTELEVRIDRFREFYEDFEMRFPGRGLTLSGTADLPEDASVTAGEAAPSATLTRSGTLQVRVPKSERARTVTVDDEPAAEPDASAADGDDTDDTTRIDIADGADGEEDTDDAENTGA